MSARGCQPSILTVCRHNKPFSQGYKQTRCSRGCSTITFVTHWLIDGVSQCSFSSKPSKYCYTKTVRARELKCLDNVQHPQFVACHVSCVRRHVSCVPFFSLFFPSKWWSQLVEGLLSMVLPRLVKMRLVIFADTNIKKTRYSRAVLKTPL